MMPAWHHIYMDGEYDFSDERVNTITKFSLSKVLGLKLTGETGRGKQALERKDNISHLTSWP